VRREEFCLVMEKLNRLNFLIIIAASLDQKHLIIIAISQDHNCFIYVSPKTVPITAIFLDPNCLFNTFSPPPRPTVIYLGRNKNK
jgi:hypothetical protein